jgi:hypothetical protein
MKPIKSMTQAELAAYVQNSLHRQGIEVVLSGGATVAIYSSNKYVSKDIDLINVHFADRKKIRIAMEEIGFRQAGRSFEYPGTKFFVEFPPGPLSVGDEPIKQVDEIKYETGILKVISPTECVKDRLSNYYHFGDRQCLAQAILVAQNNKIDYVEIKRWSESEGKGDDFELIRNKFIKQEMRPSGRR